MAYLELPINERMAKQDSDCFYYSFKQRNRRDYKQVNNPNDSLRCGTTSSMRV